MTGYELSRYFYDWSFENPEKVNPNHAAIYFFAIEQCNRLGWVPVFALPSSMAMAATGIKSYNTYIKALHELIDFGFISMVQKSKNQFTANFIALSKIDKALDKALDKAMMKHHTKQLRGIYQSIDSIIKQVNNETIKPTNQGTEKAGSNEPAVSGSLFPSDSGSGQMPGSSKSPGGKKGRKKERTQFEKDCFNLCKNIWFEQRNPTEFSGSDGSSLYGLIGKIRKKTIYEDSSLETPALVASNFNIFLQAISQLKSDWYKSQDLKTLNSKFDTIFLEFKNQSNNDKRPTTKRSAWDLFR